MTGLPTACGRLWALLRSELRQLLQFNRSDRRWQLPFCAALASGLPLMVGLYFDHIEYGLVSSLGGLIFLYTPATPLAHRMMVLMSCSFGMIACHALGIMSHFLPMLRIPILTFVAILIVMLCRVYAIGPPRGVFFMMAASINAFSPVELLTLPLSPWGLPLMIMVPTFIVETLVVRHYGLAVIFITPMTLLLADASLLGHGSTGSLLQARLLDTVAGSFAGLLGGVVLHTQRLHDAVGQALRRLTPPRLRS